MKLIYKCMSSACDQHAADGEITGENMLILETKTEC